MILEDLPGGSDEVGMEEIGKVEELDLGSGKGSGEEGISKEALGSTRCGKGSVNVASSMTE